MYDKLSKLNNFRLEYMRPSINTFWFPLTLPSREKNMTNEQLLFIKSVK